MDIRNNWITIIRSLLAGFLALSCGHGSAQSNTLLRYVNLFIGTAKSNVFTKWGGNGGTYPGAVAPSGFIQLSPETRIDGTKGYDYSDSMIYHFSCLNHFSGFPDGSSGRLFVMPVIATEKFDPGHYARRFSHRSETATPGYYRVAFTDNNTIAETTVSKRAGIFRFTFPAGVTPQLFITDAGVISCLSDRVLHGSLFHSILNFSERFIVKKDIGGGCLFTFSQARNGTIIVLKVSTSSVSFSGAKHNLEVELKNWSFNKVRESTAGDWIKRLAIVQVNDNNEKNKSIFYTALYHSNLIPWVISDVDGRYKGADGLIHQASGNSEFGGFSPWDTFRSLHPLLSLLYPGRQNDIILSMLDIFKQTGHLPTESMTGNHAIPIIVDAYMKGINSFDKVLAYAAMKKTIVDPPFVQKDMDSYHKLGYVPFSKPESVTRTVEYAYDDWALSQYAKLFHHTREYKRLIQRSNNYINLFNPGQLFLLPRQGNRFNLQPGMSGYKEGDKWVYSYFVPHNPNGLINLMGGSAAFADRLDSALRKGLIVFDNETVLHLPYLFNAAGRPSLTQKWCRKIMSDRYDDSPGGLPGNDDLGAMSSWFVFSALGIFPSCPGRPLYSVGLPLFKKVTLHLPNGKLLTIRSQNQGSYVHALQVNGRPYGQAFITHSTLERGGAIDFKMSSVADNKWAAGNNPIRFSETKTPVRIQLLGYKFSASKVAPHKLFWIHFRLKNTGSIGTKRIVLYVNGAVYNQKNCLVNGGGILTDSISCRLYTPGEATLKLGDMGVTKINVVMASTSGHPFEITALSAKHMIRISDRQAIAYTIQNTGGLKQLFKVPLTLNGALFHTDSVILEPGEKRNIKDTLSAGTSGFHTLAVGSQKTLYKVYSNSRESLLLDLSFSRILNNSVLADRSGFGNNGYIRVTRITGKAGNNKPAMLGNDCFIEVLHSSNLDVMHESMTMMAWVYPTAEKPGLVDLLSKGDFNVLQVADTKNLTFFAGGWSRGDCTVPLPVNWIGHWHHVAGVCQKDVLRLYIDGKLTGTSKLDHTVNLSTSAKWNIGRNEEFPSERIFAGYIDQVKIYEQNLSAEDILAIVNTEKKYLISLQK